MKRGIKAAASADPDAPVVEVGQSFITATDPGDLFAQDQIQYTILGEDVVGDEFTSDAVCWPETGQEIGVVPNEFVNYTMLRCQAAHFNLHETCSFGLNGLVTVIYGHPTFNDKSKQPPFLATWTDTLLVGEMQVPDRDSVPQPCPVYFYSKTISLLDWTWYSILMQERMSYFVGFFLFPPGETPTFIFPEVYEILAQPINDPYIPPVHDEYYWDNAPSARPATTSQATSWDNFESRINNAGPGSVVAAPIGTFANQGQRTLNGINGTKEDPIWIVANQQSGFPTTRMTGTTGWRFNNCSFIRVYGFDVPDGTNNASHQFFFIEENCKWIILQENWMDDFGSADNSATVHGIIIQGDYCRVSQNTFSNKQSPGSGCRLQPSSEDKAGQFCRFDHNKFIGWNKNGNVDPDKQNHLMIGAGQNSNFDQRIHTLIDHNHLEDYTKTPSDTEAGLIKGRGCIVWANYISDMKGRGLNNRQASWTVHIRNLETLDKTSPNDDSMTTLQGTETTPGDVPEGELIIYGNWFEQQGHANAWLKLQSVSSTDSNRYVCPDSLIADNMGFNARRRCFSFNGTADNKPTNCHIIGNAFDCDEEVVDEDYLESEGDFIWSGNVFFGSSLGMIDPGGITFESPGFADRGDGIEVPTNVNLDLALANCCPFPLETKVIPNLGTSYASA